MRRVSIGTKTEDNLYLHNKNPCYIQCQKYYLKSYIRIRKAGGIKFLTKLKKILNRMNEVKNTEFYGSQ